MNQITDLRPVCPSCRGMVHWFRPMLTIEEAHLLWSTELSTELPRKQVLAEIPAGR